MTTIISDEPKPVYVVPAPRVADVRPSPHIEAIVRQQKSAIVEAYKLDGKRVKVIIVEKS